VPREVQRAAEYKLTVKNAVWYDVDSHNVVFRCQDMALMKINQQPCSRLIFMRDKSVLKRLQIQTGTSIEYA